MKCTFLTLLSFIILFDFPLIKTASRKQQPMEEEQPPLFLPQLSYILKLIVPPTLQKPTGSTVKCYFNGKPYSFNEENLAVITDKKFPYFTVVITQTVDVIMQSNQKKYFKRKKGVPFAWYNLELIFDNPFDPFICPRYHWRISAATETPERIPDHALIICLDAQLIENIMVPPCESCHEDEKKGITTHFCSIYFPFITIKKNVTREEWTQSINKHALDLDIKTFHKRNEPQVRQVNPQHIITLPPV